MINILYLPPLLDILFCMVNCCYIMAWTCYDCNQCGIG